MRRLICLFRGHQWRDDSDDLGWPGLIVAMWGGYVCRRCGERAGSLSDADFRRCINPRI